MKHQFKIMFKIPGASRFMKLTSYLGDTYQAAMNSAMNEAKNYKTQFPHWELKVVDCSNTKIEFEVKAH